MPRKPGELRLNRLLAEMGRDGRDVTPGSLLRDTDLVSADTIRHWIRQGWVEDVAAVPGTGPYYTLTLEGYRASNPTDVGGFGGR